MEYVMLCLGVLASQVSALIVATHKRLEHDAGVELPRWSNIAAIVGSTVIGIAAAYGAGYSIHGHVGAIWSACGGVIGPQVWPSVRELTLNAISKRADRA